MRRLRILIVALFLIASCSTTNGRKGMGPRPGTPEYEAQADSPKAPPPCSTWLNRGRAGGAAGTVAGFIAASAIGTPVLGLLFTAAGYGAGFASKDNCKKQDSAVASAQTQSDGASKTHTPPAAPKIVEEEIQ